MAKKAIKKGGSKKFWIIGGVVLLVGGITAYFLLRRKKNEEEPIEEEQKTDEIKSEKTVSEPKISTPSELNTPEKIKAFQDWMDLQGKGWIKKDGKWVLLNKGTGYGNFGESTNAVWKVYGQQYLSERKKGTDDVPVKLKPFVERNVVGESDIKPSSYGKYIAYTHKTPNGNIFTFNFLENGFFKVFYPEKLKKQYGKTVAYEGTFEDGGRTLKIKKDDYGFGSKNLTGTTINSKTLPESVAKLFVSKSSFVGMADELEFANFDNNLDLNL